MVTLRCVGDLWAGMIVSGLQLSKGRLDGSASLADWAASHSPQGIVRADFRPVLGFLTPVSQLCLTRTVRLRERG
jgi:hypothetical protein